MIENIVNKIKGWWKSMFDYNKIIKDFELDIQTSSQMLDAFQEWSKIYNGNEPWIDKNTMSLHTAKTISEKVAESVVNEYKSVCSEPYINEVYQKFLKKAQTNVEYMVGKSCIFFKPYYDDGSIKVNVIQADKFIPVKFDDTGELLGCITIDQLTKGNTIYTRLEYSEISDKKINIKNIAYKGSKNGTILERKINLKEVPEWDKIEENSTIEGVEHLIGGFATMPIANTLDNSSPIGMPIWFKSLDTIKEIDKQFSRIIWEYEGSELAIDIDETLFRKDTKTGRYINPTGKDRLFRKMSFNTEIDKSYNVFSPQIRDTSLFNGLNEYLRLVEVQCHLEHGTLSKAEISPKTAQEIKQMKQAFYTTITNIQRTMEQAFDDLIYGIYVLCKLYGIAVQNDYIVEHEWDDSILVDKESERNTALIERNANITSDVQYIMDTKNMKEKEAIEYVKKQNEYKKLTMTQEDEVVEE